MQGYQKRRCWIMHPTTQCLLLFLPSSMLIFLLSYYVYLYSLLHKY
ncbi:hypothetical protein LINPERHAP2_LOCUS14203 [Linum perenne]